MPTQRLQDFLDSQRVPYTTIRHTTAYTAQGTAASVHIPGKEFAKSVVVSLDGRLTLAVLPAPARLDLDRLRASTGAERAELASEERLRELFPDCELGAMPPFGNLYGLEVLVAEELAQDEEIAFNAGTHTELIRMAYDDFALLVRPRVVALTAAR